MTRQINRRGHKTDELAEGIRLLREQGLDPTSRALRQLLDRNVTGLLTHGYKNGSFTRTIAANGLYCYDVAGDAEQDETSPSGNLYTLIASVKAHMVSRGIESLEVEGLRCQIVAVCLSYAGRTACGDGVDDGSPTENLRRVTCERCLASDVYRVAQYALANFERGE